MSGLVVCRSMLESCARFALCGFLEPGLKGKQLP